MKTPTTHKRNDYCVVDIAFFAKSQFFVKIEKREYAVLKAIYEKTSYGDKKTVDFKKSIVFPSIETLGDLTDKGDSTVYKGNKGLQKQ